MSGEGEGLAAAGDGLIVGWETVEKSLLDFG